MGASFLADAHRYCDVASYARDRYTLSSILYRRALLPRSVIALHRGQPYKHAKRPCLPVLAASSTQASPNSRVQTEKQIAKDLLQTDLPYSTHSWQWKGHKVNFAVRPTDFPLHDSCFPPCNTLLLLHVHAHAYSGISITLPFACTTVVGRRLWTSSSTCPRIWGLHWALQEEHTCAGTALQGRCCAVRCHFKVSPTPSMKHAPVTVQLRNASLQGGEGTSHGNRIEEFCLNASLCIYQGCILTVLLPVWA